VGADPDLSAPPAGAQAGEGGRAVDARSAVGVQVGEGNTQIIYTYNRLTWTDGVAPPPLADVSGVVDSPYRGLSAFEERDAAFFFGREAAATRVLELMSVHLDGLGLLVVSGVSGAGKSSLLRAGVLPRLRGAGLAGAPGAASWPCLLFTPARAPLDELAVRVASLAGADAAAVRRGLAADPAGFALIARQAALAQPAGPGDPDGAGPGPHQRPQPRRRLLLVVDQFEQVFTQCPDDEQRRAFITALHAAATMGSGPDQGPAALVVLGVRADFEARCADYPQLADAVQDRYLVTPMTGRQLRMAITEPARKTGSSVDDDLVKVLLGEVGSRDPASSPAVSPFGAACGAGVLPLLSHALDQAWRSRTGDVLSLADYERAGGIEGAVADSAQRAYGRLAPAQQAVARQVFTRLTATSSDGVDTADRAARAELTDGRSEAGVRDVEAVLEAFATERLLTLAAGTVEISHEALLTAWPLLRGTWLAETHADRIVRTRLHNAAADWARDSRDPSYLYSGSLLEAAAETATRIGADPVRHPPLSQTEQAFLAAAHRQRRRATARRRSAAAALAVLAIAVSIASAVARHEATNARQRDQAIYNQTVAEARNLGISDPSLAAQLNLAAYRMQPTQELTSRLLSTENTPLSTSIPDSAAVASMAVSPHGHTLATTSRIGVSGAGGVVRLWDVASPAHPRALGEPLATGRIGVNWATFSPDGRTLATSSDDGTIRLWDVGDPAHPRALGEPLATGSISVDAAAFSPDGRTLAVGGSSSRADAVVWLWDVASSAHPRALGEPLAAGRIGVNAVAFSPDGRTLAVGGDSGAINLWDVASPAHPRALGEPLATGSMGVNAVAFSPDGRTLATGGDGGEVRLWDMASSTPTHVLGPPLTTGNASVLSVAFSPDSRTLATSGNSGVLRLWDVASPAHPQALGHALTGSTVGAKSGSVAFSPDGRTLATGGYDSAVRLWSLPHMVLTASINPVESVTFSPDGRTLAVAAGTADGADAAGAGTPDPGANGSGNVAGMTGFGVGGVIQLWDVATPAHPRALGQPWAIGKIGVNAVAFSRDGRTLAVGGVRISIRGIVGIVGVVRLWDVASPAHPRALGPSWATGSGAVLSVAFSRDGRTLATGGDSGVVRLWDMATPAHPRALGEPLATGRIGVNAVAFSPDRRTLATGGASGVVRLWDVTSPAHPQALGHVLTGRTTGSGHILSVAFSRGGRTLATGGDSGVVRRWDVASPAHPQALGPSLTVSTDSIYSVAFSPDGRTLATGGDSGVVRLWNLNVSYAIKRICTTATNDLTPQQWRTYIPQEPYQPPCTQSER
jgi:WD40 repeat protein